MAEHFKSDTKTYPEDLMELVSNQKNRSGWLGPYIKKSILTDPWGSSYTYTASKNGITICSLGADKTPGGHGEGKDICLSRGDEENRRYNSGSNG